MRTYRSDLTEYLKRPLSCAPLPPVPFQLYLSVIELARFSAGGDGLGFVRVTPIQIISDQWDYAPLRRNQTHSLSRRLELPAFALTFQRVPAFQTQTQERGRLHGAHMGEDEIFFIHALRTMAYI